MTIVVPGDYHARLALEENQIQCISQSEAACQDIRELRIGILNIMPVCQDYEFNLLHPLGISILQVKPIWIRLSSHSYKSSDQDYVKNLYVTYEEAVRDQPLDGLIVTGAPIERLAFEEVSYWKEIGSILRHSQQNTPSTLGICWGAFALAYLAGVDKLHYAEKLFGVFEVYNLDSNHPITGELDDVFWCPQGRHAGIDDAVLEQAAAEGKFRLLAHGPDCGYVIFETPDHRFVMHTGHPEYSSQRLATEAKRDLILGRPIHSQNFDFHHPINRWKSHRNLFFTQWLKYCYLQIDGVSTARINRL